MMSGRRGSCPIVLLGSLAMAGCAAAPPPEPEALRVCADPNNLPFSNRAGEGFENAVAEIVAHELGAPLEYFWWPQRRGFVRNTLRAGSCDVIIGVPYAWEMVLPTRPWYRSSYVFVSRPDGPDLESLDDPRLRDLRVGVQVIGDDYLNTPPVHALTRRGVIGNLRPYRVLGDYAAAEPHAPVVEAVLAGDVDVALVWGPVAGYTARRLGGELRIEPVRPEIDVPFLPLVYDIAMGVRREDTILRARLDGAIERRMPEIEAVLREFSVPTRPARIRRE